MIKKSLLIFTTIFSILNVTSQTPISENLYGQNAWMPSILFSGESESVIDKINSDGDEPFNIIRIGCTTFDDHAPTWAEFENLIVKIRSIGAEPLI